MGSWLSNFCLLALVGWWSGGRYYTLLCTSVCVWHFLLKSLTTISISSWNLPSVPQAYSSSCLWHSYLCILQYLKPDANPKIVVFIQLFSHVWLFLTPWTAAHQASLFFAISRSLLKLMSIESVMPSNHLILCRPLVLLPSIFPSIRVFSNESVLRIRWPKYWSFSFSNNPSNEYLVLFDFQPQPQSEH